MQKKIKNIASICLLILPFFIFYVSKTSAEVTNMSNPAASGSDTAEALLLSKKPAIEMGTAGKRIAILPFDNLTIDSNALNAVMPVIHEEMKNRGYSVVEEQELYSYICKFRVRETGIISKDLANKIFEIFKVDGILLGSIVAYSISEKPQFGLIARLIDPSDGSILWAEYFSANGDDFTIVLGLGEIKEMDKLISKVVNSLFESFTTEAQQKDAEAAYRIAVMPFMNDTNYKDAGQIASQMFVVHLFKESSFIPVEYGEVKKQLVDLRVRLNGNLDFKSMDELAKVIGVDGFLLGEVGLYFNDVRHNAPPSASLSARLIGSVNKKVIWYEHGEMSGDDDVIIYDWRRLKSVDKVADKIIAKLVNNLEKIKWN